MGACFRFRRRSGFQIFLVGNVPKSERVHCWKKKKVKNISQRKARKRKECICERRFWIKSKGHCRHHFPHGSSIILSFFLSYAVVTKGKKEYGKLPSPRQHLTWSNCSRQSWKLHAEFSSSWFTSTSSFGVWSMGLKVYLPKEAYRLLM